MINSIAVGDKMISTGNSQKTTGQKIKLSSAKMRLFGDSLKSDSQIVKTIGAMKIGIVSVRNILTPFQAALGFLADTFHAFKIPTIQVDTTTIPGINIKVVNKVSIGSAKPLNAAGDRCETMKTNITDLRESLKTMADSLSELKGAIPAIQNNIYEMSDDLSIAGDEMISTGNGMIATGSLIKA